MLNLKCDYSELKKIKQNEVFKRDIRNIDNSFYFFYFCLHYYIKTL